MCYLLFYKEKMADALLPELAAALKNKQEIEGEAGYI